MHFELAATINLMFSVKQVNNLQHQSNDWNRLPVASVKIYAT